MASIASTRLPPPPWPPLPKAIFGTNASLQVFLERLASEPVQAIYRGLDERWNRRAAATGGSCILKTYSTISSRTRASIFSNIA